MPKVFLPIFLIGLWLVIFATTTLIHRWW